MNGVEIKRCTSHTLFYASWIKRKWGVHDVHEECMRRTLLIVTHALIHFQLNIGGTPAVTNAAFGSQNPGRVAVADTVFGSIPGIPDDVLTRAFQVNETIIRELRSRFAPVHMV
ncbi:hypothetical protein RND81_10G225400 [Saponaria officinalis]|uniref:Germin-like protein n=1 Tax=Saponaria officinalis TaxID=3572 RepID=A0AAW1I655_SAPOF